MKHQLFALLCIIAISMLSCTDPGQGETTTTKEEANSETPPPPVEFADAKYMDIAKASMTTFASKNIAKWSEDLADNARYLWNSGDSLVGKQAIVDFWTDRMTNTIESLKLENSIYLPLIVNEPQSIEAPGLWVLTWHQVTVKYLATGKSMTQWIHSDMHFNSDNKIDQVSLYLDRLLIQQATTK